MAPIEIRNDRQAMRAQGFVVALTSLDGTGLFDRYRQWSSASGYQPLGRNKFSREVLRVVPGAAKAPDTVIAPSTCTVTAVFGVALKSAFG